MEPDTFPRCVLRHSVLFRAANQDVQKYKEEDEQEEQEEQEEVDGTEFYAGLKSMRLGANKCFPFHGCETQDRPRQREERTEEKMDENKTDARDSNGEGLWLRFA